MEFITIPLILLFIFFCLDEWVALILFIVWLLAGYPNVLIVQGWVQETVTRLLA